MGACFVALLSKESNCNQEDKGAIKVKQKKLLKIVWEMVHVQKKRNRSWTKGDKTLHTGVGG